MKDKYQELTEKYNLVTSREWVAIRQLMLNHIVSLSKSRLDPVLIQGMLVNIADTDEWENNFLAEKQKLDKVKKE